MTVYVLKDNQTGKYIHYSEYGYGIDFVVEISKATFMTEQVAKACCRENCKVVEVKIEEVKEKSEEKQNGRTN